jgi:SLT domain-containing protein
VHKRDVRSLVFDLRTEFRELGDRLAAKRSAKMAEENQEQWTILRKGMNSLAGLRTV